MNRKKTLLEWPAPSLPYGKVHPALHRNGAYRGSVLTFLYLVCCLYVTFLLPLQPHTIGQTWSGPIKLGPTCSTFICFKMWDIRSCSRLQYLTLTFTRYYSRYRGTRDSNKILSYLYTYFTQGSGF